MSPAPAPFRVVFVCSGNICRSPMAQVVFGWFAHSVGLGDRIISTSAGTGDWHVGERADRRAVDALERHDYEPGNHRARQFTYRDFDDNDLVVAMDSGHERVLREWARGDDDEAKIALLRSFDPTAHGSLDVPDPYYADAGVFDDVLAMIESGCRALFRQFEPAIRALG